MKPYLVSLAGMTFADILATRGHIAMAVVVAHTVGALFVLLYEARP